MKSESVKWVVWCDPVENAKSMLKKFLVLTDDRQEFVAECRTPEEAGLIAAAPELLEACKSIEPRMDRAGRGDLATGPQGKDREWDQIKSKIRAAIAKAEGQP